MANPAKYKIKENTVVKIATNVLSGTISKHPTLARNLFYYVTYRLTGESAPDYDTVKDEGLKMFQDNPEQETIGHSVAIDKSFDLHWVSISDISAVLDGVIDIFADTGEGNAKIGSVDVVRTANFSREGSVRVQVPQQPANTKISCRFTDSTGSSRTVRVKFYGHVYGASL